jgi:glutamate synthase (NADPH/NADH) small chain
MYGCPLGNRIPDYTDAIAHGHWKEALHILHATNNFPEITGHICPALCEASCTLAVNFAASTCQQIELRIAEYGWEQGWIIPQIPAVITGKRVAIVGSGPAGLAAAQQIRRSGHEVVVFERSRQLGGLLTYGIPPFKLEKWIVQRRIDQIRREQVIFETDVHVGIDLSLSYLAQKFDAVVYAAGTPTPRDLAIPGRSLSGIHFALDFLSQYQDEDTEERSFQPKRIDATGKHVVVIGGGDTGSDCVGTALRRKCASVTQIELLPEPPLERSLDNPWPQWPRTRKTTTSHEEGGSRLWSIGTVGFTESDGHVSAVQCVKLAWNGSTYREIAGSEFSLKADLVLLSMGFLPNRQIDEFFEVTDKKLHQKIFCAGDAQSGPSLVVRAINSGRSCAEDVKTYLR